MLEIRIPGRGLYSLAHVVLDVNGTVAVSGRLLEGVAECLHEMRAAGLEIHWITADSRGCQSDLDQQMGWPAVRVVESVTDGEGEQKAALVRSLGSESVVAIGNGSNDAAMLREAAIGIAVLGPEGLAVDAMQAADILAPDIHVALKLIQEPACLLATWRR